MYGRYTGMTPNVTEMRAALLALNGTEPATRRRQLRLHKLGLNDTVEPLSVTTSSSRSLMKWRRLLLSKSRSLSSPPSHQRRQLSKTHQHRRRRLSEIIGSTQGLSAEMATKVADQHCDATYTDEFAHLFLGQARCLSPHLPLACLLCGLASHLLLSLACFSLAAWDR